jgi:hypothetical protein
LLRDPRIAKPIRFVIAPGPTESSLQPLAERDLTQAFEPAPLILRRPDQITEKLAASRRENRELWKWFLAVAVGLIFLEAWMTRRETSGTVAEGRPA